MKINSVNKNNPYFGNSIRQTIRAGEVINRNYTELLRDGKDFWKNTAEMLERKYPNGDVNLTCYGCSEGSEPVSLVVSMFEWAKNFINKCKPLKAYDIDPEIIRQAKTWTCNLFEDDLYFISNNILKKHYSEYFSMAKRTDINFDIAVVPKQKIQDKINYGVADIFEHVDKLNPKEKNGVFCRNFWNYLAREKRGPLAEKLHDKTLNDGFIVVGDYDRKRGVYEILERHNFKQDKTNQFIWYAK